MDHKRLTGETTRDLEGSKIVSHPSTDSIAFAMPVSLGRSRSRMARICSTDRGRPVLSPIGATNSAAKNGPVTGIDGSSTSLAVVYTRTVRVELRNSITLPVRETPPRDSRVRRWKRLKWAAASFLTRPG